MKFSKAVWIVFLSCAFVLIGAVHGAVLKGTVAAKDLSISETSRVTVEATGGGGVIVGFEIRLSKRPGGGGVIVGKAEMIGD